MLRININDDLLSKKYNIGRFKGLNGRELAYSIVALVICIVGTFIMNSVMGLHMLLAVYMTSPIAFGIGYIGFYNKHGMNFSEMYKKKRQLRRNQKEFTFSSKQAREEMVQLKEVSADSKEVKLNGLKRNKKGN